jgi:hypothetical protein
MNNDNSTSSSTNVILDSLLLQTDTAPTIIFPNVQRRLQFAFDATTLASRIESPNTNTVSDSLSISISIITVGMR